MHACARTHARMHAHFYVAHPSTCRDALSTIPVTLAHLDAGRCEVHLQLAGGQRDQVGDGAAERPLLRVRQRQPPDPRQLRQLQGAVLERGQAAA